MIIYIDVIIFENLIMNYIILVSTSIIGKYKIRYLRSVLSSLLGGIYAIYSYISHTNTIVNFVVKICISIIMIIIAFDFKNFKILVKQLFLFYLVSFTFGGAAFMLLFLLKPQDIVLKNGHLVGTYPIKIALLGGTIGFAVILIVSNIIIDRRKIKSMLCDLEIFYNNKSTKIKAMIDTGNLLKDPISNNDVIIVEKNSLKDIFDNDILEHIDDILAGKWLDDCVHNYKFKIIPFSSLGNENGIILGFKPSYIKIYDENEIIRNDAIIGIYCGKLTKTNLYTSLVGPDYSKGGMFLK